MASSNVPVSIKDRKLAYSAVIIGIGLVMVDQSATNMALPTIAQSLNLSATGSIIVINLYQLVLAAALIPLAALGSRIGYRAIYLGGLALACIALIGCHLSSSVSMFAMFRGLQGLAAAGIMSVNLAMVRHIVPKERLGSAIGFNAMVVALCSTGGPAITGFIISHFSWHWIFLFIAPFAALAFLLGFRSLPENERSPRPFDWTSATFCALFFGMVVLCMAGAGQNLPWWSIASGVFIAILAAYILFRRERGQSNPLVPLDLLTIPEFRLALCASTATFAAQMLAFVSIPFLLQMQFGFSVAETSLLFIPWPVAVAIAGPLSGYLSDRYASSVISAAGLSLMCLGSVLIALLHPDADAMSIGWRMALCGLGFGIFQAPNNKAIISSAPASRSGGASSALGAARLMGQSAGTALAAGGLAFFGMSSVIWLGSAASALALMVCVYRAVLQRYSEPPQT